MVRDTPRCARAFRTIRRPGRASTPLESHFPAVTLHEGGFPAIRGAAPNHQHPRMWDGHVTAWEHACNTAPVSHVCVIIIDERVG
jgi:hypothetical protein